MAYVFLRAVLEYPKMSGERLAKDVERWGRWVTDKLREDPDVKGLYDKETIGGGTGGGQERTASQAHTSVRPTPSVRR
jgi:hypothetical protein